MVLSLLVVFLKIQNYSMHTDYLTGVNNRKKLDAYLKERVSLSTEGKGFSAVLIDINSFKYINDTFGHDIGDNALETAAKLLKS
ncbi:MAG: diguanylate cyclase [Clostridiaceae bacterium]|nr:diguanylate cyclase [Clostridiaceae bacterium]